MGIIITIVTIVMMITTMIATRAIAVHKSPVALTGLLSFLREQRERYAKQLKRPRR
jgi:hypothetical protein